MIRADSKTHALLLQGFVNVLYVASAIFAIWAGVVVFFPAKSAPVVIGGILAIAVSLFVTARMAQQQGRVKTWMRWVPSLAVMPVFAITVYANGTYALTTISVVLAIHALFLPKVASRCLMALTLAVAFLPFLSGQTVDLMLWVRLVAAGVLGLALFDFAGRRILLLAHSLEDAQHKLTKQNQELIAAKSEIEAHKESLENEVRVRTSELEVTNASLESAKAELEAVNQHLEQLVSERTENLKQVNQDLSDAIVNLERLAETDGLTGLFNRRHFIELAKAEVFRAIRYQTPLSMIMLDVDHFKSINDRFGHHAGDVALTALAAFLDSTKRQSDIIGRLGGEEFAILLPNTSLDHACLAGERLRAGIEAISLNDSGNAFGMTVSLGIVQLQNDSIDELLNRADNLMYKAKAQGRNRICAN